MEDKMKRTAFTALNKRYHILAPAAEARVIFPDFNPFRAGRQIIAIIEWPATVAMREVLLTHTIRDGDPV